MLVGFLVVQSKASKGEISIISGKMAEDDKKGKRGLSLSVDTETTDFNSDGASNGDTLFNSNSRI